MSVLVALQGGAEFTSTASWEQAPASWAATAQETFAATASFTQAAASWAASGSEAFEATASFTQAAASWSATASEVFATSATFAQATATWSATASEVFTGTGAWEQTASWAAAADAPIPRAPHGAALVTGPARPYVTRTTMAATFVQPAASWRSETDTYEPLALYLLTDEPALVGAR